MVEIACITWGLVNFIASFFVATSVENTTEKCYVKLCYGCWLAYGGLQNIVIKTSDGTTQYKTKYTTGTTIATIIGPKTFILWVKQKQHNLMKTVQTESLCIVDLQ